jgi:hypothetical protein
VRCGGELGPVGLSIVSRLPRNRGSILGRDGDCSLFHSVQACPGAHTKFYIMETVGSLGGFIERLWRGVNRSCFIGF